MQANKLLSNFFFYNINASHIIVEYLLFLNLYHKTLSNKTIIKFIEAIDASLQKVYLL